MAKKPGVGGDYDWTPLGPLTKETDTTYGGGKPGKAPTQKAPKAPDPFELIAAQGRENRVNEVGPSGSTIYSKDPTTGVWTANRTFSPELQGLYNKQVALSGEDPNAYNDKVANAMFDRQKSMLDPVFAQQNRAQEQGLANKGIPMGSEAYNQDWTNTNRAQNEAYLNAANQATLSGTQAGMAQRQNEFNQMAALLGGQQVGPTSPIDVTGPFASQYQGQLNSVNAANANAAQRNSQTTSGATALASLLAMMLCWVSEELYGYESAKTKRIRTYLNDNKNSRFSLFYAKHGLRWAAWVRYSKPVKFCTRILFNLIDILGRKHAETV